jgi:hypothetical protein
MVSDTLGWGSTESLSLLELYCKDIQSRSESWHHLPQSSCSGGSNSGLGCWRGEWWHELRVVLHSNGIVYFLKREFKQCRKAGRSKWQSPGFPWLLYWDWLSCCYGYKPKCRTSCSWDQVFLVPCRERTGEFSNCPFGLLQSLLGLLHKSYSDSTPFQEALEVLILHYNNVKSYMSIKIFDDILYVNIFFNLRSLLCLKTFMNDCHNK